MVSECNRFENTGTVRTGGILLTWAERLMGIALILVDTLCTLNYMTAIISVRKSKLRKSNHGYNLQQRLEEQVDEYCRCLYQELKDNLLNLKIVISREKWYSQQIFPSFWQCSRSASFVCFSLRAWVLSWAAAFSATFSWASATSRDEIHK